MLNYSMYTRLRHRFGSEERKRTQTRLDMPGIKSSICGNIGNASADSSRLARV